MLAVKTPDRNHFRDSEEYRTLIAEVSALASSVGGRFVPYSENDVRNNERNNLNAARETDNG